AAVRLGVREIAELAEVAPYTVSRFETEQGGLRLDTAEKLKAALERLGVKFTTDDQGRACICYEVPPKGGME
ncbi:LacI family DNA-binding transcriptional regulator, partial [Methylobacterium sp. Leaf113]|uniref:LacI family DNA-binding transcriptional regulator n=1 Tax=Methylobacterium sp. Leaf113 TaxID=1736259 RepID=UPI0009EAE2E3